MLQALLAGSPPTAGLSATDFPSFPLHEMPSIIERLASFEHDLTTAGITLIRPTFGKEHPRPHQRFLRPFRQIIESVNQTLKAQLDLERHGGRTKPGVCARVLQRLLALTRPSGTTKPPTSPDQRAHFSPPTTHPLEPTI